MHAVLGKGKPSRSRGSTKSQGKPCSHYRQPGATHHAAKGNDSWLTIVVTGSTGTWDGQLPVFWGPFGLSWGVARSFRKSQNDACYIDSRLHLNH